MLRWLQNQFRDHFGVSRAEANGMLVLLLVSLIFLLIPPGLKWYYSRRPLVSHDEDIALLEDMLKQLEAQRQSAKPRPAKPTQRSRRPPKPQRFDINTANATQLRTIKGIGEILSARIVKFRDKLGGFVQLDQYEEVYGLQPEVVDRLKRRAYISLNFRPQCLDINTVDIQTLAAHPYLTYQQARAIVRYREQHGLFPHLEALKDLVLKDSTMLEKIRPYLVAH
ncbi:MAG: helix-hairpin-helix domain-containing protein [Bacteroidota bacterium]